MQRKCKKCGEVILGRPGDWGPHVCLERYYVENPEGGEGEFLSAGSVDDAAERWALKRSYSVGVGERKTLRCVVIGPGKETKTVEVDLVVFCEARARVVK